MSDDRHSRIFQDQQEARTLEKWDKLADEREAAQSPLRQTTVADHRTLAGRSQSAERKPAILTTIGDPYALTTSELARIVAAAVRRHHRVRRADLSEYERDALAQDVTVSLLPGCRRGRPAEVLAWIDYAWTHPALAARAERIPRGTVGRTLIDSRIERVLHESRGWRDTVESYRVKERAARDTERAHVAQVIAADFSEPDEDDSAMSAPYRALMAESIERGDLAAPIALDASELADQLANTYGTREREHVRAAIIRVLADDPAIALAKLARKRGKSLNAIRVDASKGAAILRKLDLRVIRELAGASRDTAGLDTEQLLRNLPAAWCYLPPRQPSPEPRLSRPEPESLVAVGR